MKLFQPYNHKNFEITLNSGKTLLFVCYTTDTRNGFTHQCQSVDFPKLSASRVCYTNRTWEGFDYETVLRHFIGKLPKALRGEVEEKIMAQGQAESRRFCQKVDAFASTFQALSDESKQHLANAFPDGVQTQEQAEALMFAGNMFAALEALSK